MSDIKTMNKKDFAAAVKLIGDMSVEQLTEIGAIAEQTITQRKAFEEAAITAKLEAMAAEAGYDIKKLYGMSKREGKVAAKYRNPNDATQTWTGRGRRPSWVIAAEEAGKSLDTMLIVAPAKK